MWLQETLLWENEPQLMFQILHSVETLIISINSLQLSVSRSIDYKGKEGTERNSSFEIYVFVC